MATPTRRVQITFDREREAFRGIVDAVTNRRKAPPNAEPSGPITESTASEAVKDAAPTGDAWLDDSTQPAQRPSPISKASSYLASLTDAYGPIPPSALASEIPFVDTLVLDASALTEIAAGNPRARALVARAVGSLSRIVVPATALRTAMHERIAEKLADVVPIEPSHAKTAAKLMLAAPGSDPYDALAVACVARADRAAIVTTGAQGVDRLVRANARPNVYVFSI